MMQRQLLVSLAGLALVSLFAAPTQAGVLINEIDYDQAGTDAAEWVELFNPDAIAQSLTGLDLVFVNGSTCSNYRTLALDAIVIPAGGYVVIGNTACAIAAPGLPATNAIQNGAPDGLSIEDRNTGSVLDSVEYEQVGVSACGPTPTPAGDNNTDVAGSIQRCGNIWVYDTIHTPCAQNNCPPVSVDSSTWGKVKADYR